ncbi:MAG: glycosyltransferase [Stagnimonas sp.]|nr:glycosyltransferase [Stagnimonas sp.]
MNDDLSARTVSIALCVYNGATHLRAQIESLLAQSHTALEIIASDDASSDDSAAILAEYAASDPRLVVISNTSNQGFSANFSSTLARCTGDFICPSDQDDVWHPQKIARLLAAITDHDLAYCDSAMVDAEGHLLGRNLSQQLAMYSGRDPLVFAMSNCISGHAMLFRRGLLERALPMPNTLYYDWWLAIVAAGGRGVLYVDTPLVEFRRHEQTVTTLGGIRQQDGVSMRVFLMERLHLLAAISSFASPRQADAARLEKQLRQWLDEGRGLPFLFSAMRFHRPLLYPLRPRLTKAARLSIKYLLALFRKP